MIGGVAGGLAQSWSIDPILVRVAFVVLCAFGGAGVVAYLVAWLVLPPDDGTLPIARRHHHDRGRIVGVALLAVGIITLINVMRPLRWWNGPDFFWPLALIFGGAAVLVLRANETEHPGDTVAAAGGTAPGSPTPGTASPDATGYDTAAQPAITPAAVPQTAWSQPRPWPTASPPWEPAARPRRRARREPSFLAPIVFSALLLFVGLAILADLANAVHVDPAVVSAVCLITIGVALFASTWFGRAHGLIALGIVLTLIGAGFASIDVPVRGGIGNREYRPAIAGDVRTKYQFGIGSLTVNLRHATFAPGTTHDVRVQLGIGKEVVLVPANVELVLKGHSGAGVVELATARRSGTGVDDETTLPVPGDAPVLRIDARVGVGLVQVFRPGDELVAR